MMRHGNSVNRARALGARFGFSGSGVYFLAEGNNVLYIGQSWLMERRLAGKHRRGLAAYSIPASDLFLDILEQHLIVEFAPPLNKRGLLQGKDLAEKRKLPPNLCGRYRLETYAKVARKWGVEIGEVMFALKWAGGTHMKVRLTRARFDATVKDARRMLRSYADVRDGAKWNQTTPTSPSPNAPVSA